MIRRILKTQFFGFLVSKWPTEVLKTMFQLKVKRAGTKRRHPKTATATVVAHSHGFHPRLKDWSKKKGLMCFELAFYQEEKLSGLNRDISKLLPRSMASTPRLQDW